MDEQTETTKWALFKDGKQISKSHSTMAAAIQEAFDLRVVVQDKFSKTLAEGYEVKHAE
jgi:hypothetical protein